NVELRVWGQAVMVSSGYSGYAKQFMYIGGAPLTFPTMDGIPGTLCPTPANRMRPARNCKDFRGTSEQEPGYNLSLPRCSGKGGVEPAEAAGGFAIRIAVVD